MNPVQVLQQYWGFDQFRPLQEEIVQSVLAGTPTLAILPTGGGKSICFQVPALMLEGVCLVVSPLIALMRDQVEQLKARGISASAIYSGLSEKEIDILLDNCVHGQVKFLYVSPERLSTSLFLARAQQMKISMLAVDEAHCISEWGFDFRPAYREIKEFLESVPISSRIALTATATPQVKQDIVDQLSFAQPAIFEGSFARLNLSYSTFELDNKEAKVLEILHRVPGSAILYAGTRKQCESYSQWLGQKGLSATHYHAGLDVKTRKLREEQWKSGSIRIMVATNAFGMGIDKSDVRVVIHTHLPNSMEALYQEAGRAGRDGRLAYTVVLYSATEWDQLKDRLLERHPSTELMRLVYDTFCNAHKLALGSHALVRLPLNLDFLVSTYSLSAREWLLGLRGLADSGVLEMSDRYPEPVRVHISVDSSELYRLQVANARFDPLIKALLRLYGGELYSQFMIIEVQAVARLAGLSLKEANSQLDYLHANQWLILQRPLESPSVLLYGPRILSKQLPLDVDWLAQRKEQTLAKAQDIQTYVRNQRICRTRQFQAYFGEHSTQDCGVCDYCLRYRKKSSAPVEERKILEFIKDQPRTVSEVLQTIKGYDPAIVKETIRMLLDAEKIRWTNDRLRSWD